VLFVHGGMLKVIMFSMLQMYDIFHCFLSGWLNI